jgi:hypothetical protein
MRRKARLGYCWDLWLLYGIQTSLQPGQTGQGRRFRGKGFSPGAVYRYGSGALVCRRARDRGAVSAFA